GPMDISRFAKLTFEINIQDTHRPDPHLEALKVETPSKLHVNLLDVSAVTKACWVPCAIELARCAEDVDLRQVVRLVLADSGRRGGLNRPCRIGLRAVRLE